MIRRTDDGIRGYVDGYNACFNLFCEIIASNKYPPDVCVELKECMERMKLNAAAVKKCGERR